MTSRCARCVLRFVTCTAKSNGRATAANAVCQLENTPLACLECLPGHSTISCLVSRSSLGCVVIVDWLLFLSVSTAQKVA